MGIQGLLPFLKKAARPVNIRNFSGCTVAVDCYCWLHKGAFSCAEKLVKGEKTDGYVHYCMKMVNMLLAAGVKPILVFDGKELPSKSATEEIRRNNRAKYRMKAKECLRSGQLKEAKECFQRCVDVTPEMAFAVIQACRQKNIDYIVAPYEADSQLAYLNKCAIAHIIITEDSDLLLFGCEKVIFKMDAGGSGIMIEKSSLYQCMGISAEKFTFDKFRYMCILSGCDYLPSLPGIGLAKSCKFFKVCTNPNIDVILPKLPTYLKMPNLLVTSEYKEGFMKANNTFLYQLVFCPLQRKLVPLNDYPPDIDPQQLQYAGIYFSDKIAYQLALGNINVNTMQKVDNFDPQKKHRITKSVTWGGKSSSAKSIWDEDYKSASLISDLSIKSTSTKRKTTVNANRILKPMNKQLLPDELLTIYTAEKSQVEYVDSSPCKKVKVESPTKENEDEPKSLKPKAMNVFKIKDSIPSTIVRSRFFYTPDKKSVQDSKVPQWLDEIQNQYKSSLCSTPKSELHQSSSSQKDEVNSDESTDTEASPAHTILALPSQNQMPAVSRNKDIGFKWSKQLKDSNKLIHNSPALKVPFKTVVRHDVQNENECPILQNDLLQASNNNSELDSGYLTQESDMHLSQESSQNESVLALSVADSDDTERSSTKDGLRTICSVQTISPISKYSPKQLSATERNSSISNKRTKLSKKKREKDRTQLKTDPRQLNIKESFARLKFLKQGTDATKSFYFKAIDSEGIVVV